MSVRITLIVLLSRQIGLQLFTITYQWLLITIFIDLTWWSILTNTLKKQHGWWLISLSICSRLKKGFGVLFFLWTTQEYRLDFLKLSWWYMSKTRKKKRSWRRRQSDTEGRCITTIIIKQILKHFWSKTESFQGKTLSFLSWNSLRRLFLMIDMLY